MRNLVTAALVLATVGCGTTTTGNAKPPIRHLALTHLHEEPAHQRALPAELTLTPDPSDPAATAAITIRSALEAQGLALLDLGVTTLTADGNRTRVLATATHTIGEASPHTSVYELDLVQTARRWRLVGYRVVQ